MLLWAFILVSSLTLAIDGSVLDAKVVNDIDTDTKRLVQVDLYYEALCPYCHLFIKDQLAPTFDVLKAYLNVSLNPFGNARERRTSEGDFVFECQHGPKECEANLMQACLFDRLEKQEQRVQVLNCIVVNDEQNGVSDNDSTSKKCFEELAVSTPSWSDVHSCAEGPEGRRLLHHLGQLTNELRPRKKWVPWIVIDDIRGKQ